MFEDAEDDIKRIVNLAQKCPAALQEKCFEVLLTAYVNAKAGPPAIPPAASTALPPAAPANTDLGAAPVAQVPDAIKGRFGSMAARLKVTQGQLAGLFDFQSDPFTYHAIAVPGSAKPQKTRSVALLIAGKTYLSTGNWTADWKEFRAMCVDQGCYDKANTGSYLNSKESYFKTASAAEGVTLSSDGVRAAEALLVSLANPGKDNDPGK